MRKRKKDKKSAEDRFITMLIVMAIVFPAIALSALGFSIQSRNERIARGECVGADCSCREDVEDLGLEFYRYRGGWIFRDAECWAWNDELNVTVRLW